MIGHGHAKDSSNLRFTSPAFLGDLGKGGSITDRETKGESKPIDCLQGWRPYFLRIRVNHHHPQHLKSSQFRNTLSQLTVCTGPSMSEWSSSVASMTAIRQAAMSSGRSKSNGVSISNDGVGIPWDEKCRSIIDVFVWIELANFNIVLEAIEIYNWIGCCKYFRFGRVPVC